MADKSSFGFSFPRFKDSLIGAPGGKETWTGSGFLRWAYDGWPVFFPWNARNVFGNKIERTLVLPSGRMGDK
jgi:hypothetical protein